MVAGGRWWGWWEAGRWGGGGGMGRQVGGGRCGGKVGMVGRQEEGSSSREGRQAVRQGGRWGQVVFCLPCLPPPSKMPTSPPSPPPLLQRVWQVCGGGGEKMAGSERGEAGVSVQNVICL